MARKKKLKRKYTRFFITLGVLFVLGLIRTYLILPEKLFWMYDMFGWAIAFLFYPLLQFFLNDVLRLDILKR